MTTETQTLETPPPVDPAVAAAAAAASAVIDPPAATDPSAADPASGTTATDPAAAADGEHGNKGKKPWFLTRISEESEARRQAEDRARNAEALLERARTNPADPAATSTTTQARTDDSAIEARARQIAQETLNTEKIQTVIRKGVGKFNDWDERAATLGAAGAASPDFVLDVFSVDPDNAHLILHQLADDPQKASHLARMDTRTRTIELVKMSMAAQGTTTPKPAAEVKPPVPPRTVSKAPPPAPAVDPGATQVVDWRTDSKISDEEWSKRWDEEQRRKVAERGRR